MEKTLIRITLVAFLAVIAACDASPSGSGSARATRKAELTRTSELTRTPGPIRTAGPTKTAGPTRTSGPIRTADPTDDEGTTDTGGTPDDDGPTDTEGPTEAAGPTGPAVPHGPAPAGIVVVLAPLASQVGPRGSIVFRASVIGSPDTRVAWSVQEGAAGGTVTASGVYSAPAAEGTFHVIAASEADASTVQVATVTVRAEAPAVSVAVTPSSSAVDACQAVAFSATVSGATNQGVTWSVKEGPSGGTITPDGVYTAPTSAGTYHVVATSLADPARTAEGPVTVAAERVLSVAVIPGTSAVPANGALALSALVTTTCGTYPAQ